MAVRTIYVTRRIDIVNDFVEEITDDMIADLGILNDKSFVDDNYCVEDSFCGFNE